MSGSAVAGSLPTVTIGANFQGLDDATFGLASIPDTDGAVGPGRFVEFINGEYRVYDQSGAVLQTMTSGDFWTAAGVTPIFAFDPRVLYDAGSGRWFVSSADSETAPGNVLLAVSRTSDPTQGWQAVSIPASATGDAWADFPTLGVNQNGVYLSFASSAGAQPVIVLPKSDLLQPALSISNATTFYFSGALERDAQAVVASGSSGPEPIAVMVSSFFQAASVDGPVTSPILNTTGRTFVLPDGVPFGGPPPAVQKGTTGGIFIRPGDEFASSVVLQGGKLFGTRSINVDNRAAVQWIVVGDPLTSPTLLDSGVISPAGLDVYNPSIAVNGLGEAVIGFTASGPNDFASAYAVAGTLNGDTLQFGDPILLKAGESSFADPQVPTPAWGDYSATTFDPDNPTHFWTIQELAGAPVEGNGLHWADQISEIIFPSATPTEQTWFGGTGDFLDPDNWTPAGTPATTDTLVIDAGRVKADGLTIANPTIQLGSATLELKNASLAAGNTIEVGAPGTDPSAFDIPARIRAVGAVAEEGAIDVGSGGSQPPTAQLAVNLARNGGFTLTQTGTWIAHDGSTIDVNARFQANFVNDGTIGAAGGTVTMNAQVSGHGIFEIGTDDSGSGDGTLEFRKSVASGETVHLDSGTLKLDEPMRFLGAIDDFGAASRIELVDTRATRADYDDGVLKLFEGHRLVAALDLVGSFTSDQFRLSHEHDNTLLMLCVPGRADPTGGQREHWPAVAHSV